MSRAKYPNRDALRKAHDIYLDAMYPFVIRCLGKVQGTAAAELISDALRLAPHDDIGEKIEISDIAHLVRTYWYDFFEEQFEAVDPHYEARSAIGLIVEGRNRASHRPWDLDPEFTRTHLFLIADALEKINRPSEKCEVEVIRDELFADDTAEQLATTSEQLKKVRTERTKYKKSLEAAEKDLETVQVEGNDYKERFETTTKELNAAKNQLKEVKTERTKYKKSFAEVEKDLEVAQAERNDYKERFETTEQELENTKAEWQTCQDDLKVTSERLEDAVGAWMTSMESLTAMRKLFETAIIGNRKVQEIFPPFETDSIVRILDQRNVDKRDYLLELLEQKQPTIIYVQSEERINQLLALVGPEKADLIGKCNERTSEAEETEIFEKLENGELSAVVSNTAFSTLTSPHCVEHFVFCHLVPGLDAFFKQCEPAFTSGKNAYLHLIYNSEQDVKGLAQKYPDREALVEMYRELRKLAGANGDFIKTENAYIALGIEKPSIETGLAIFAELQLLERNGEVIKFLPSVNTDLNKSTIHRRGEKLKEETANFRSFQLEHPIEQIWEEILAELGVDSEQILRESDTHNYDAGALKDFQTQSEQSTKAVESDSTVSVEDTEASQTPKPAHTKSSIAERYVTETTEEDRNALAVQIAEMRINATDSKPSWREIREKLGLHNDQFHKVIRLSKGYRDAVIARIKQLKATEDGWKYSGKLDRLTGIDNIEDFLK